MTSESDIMSSLDSDRRLFSVLPIEQSMRSLWFSSCVAIFVRAVNKSNLLSVFCVWSDTKAQQNASTFLYSSGKGWFSYKARIIKHILCFNSSFVLFCSSSSLPLPFPLPLSLSSLHSVNFSKIGEISSFSENSSISTCSERGSGLHLERTMW